jgi:hypothetical protein
LRQRGHIYLELILRKLGYLIFGQHKR